MKDNQPKLADSVQDFFVAFQSAPDKTPHRVDEVVEKDRGWLKVRRCYAFDQIDCLHAPERWPLPRTTFALNSSVLYEIHAIAAGSGWWHGEAKSITVLHSKNQQSAEDYQNEQ